MGFPCINLMIGISIYYFSISDRDIEMYNFAHHFIDLVEFAYCYFICSDMCSCWQITTSDSTKRVQLRVATFALGNGDTLRIYDGKYTHHPVNLGCRILWPWGMMVISYMDNTREL